MRKSLSLSLSFVLDRDIRNRVWDWELLKPSPLPPSYDHRHSRIYFFTGAYVHTFISQNRKIKTKFYISVMPFFTMIFHFTNLKKKKISFQIPQKLGPYLILSRPERRFLFFSNKNRWCDGIAYFSSSWF